MARVKGDWVVAHRLHHVVTSSLFSSSESGVPVKRLLLVLPVAVLALSACESATTPVSSGDRVLESTTVAPASPAVVPPADRPIFDHVWVTYYEQAVA